MTNNSPLTNAPAGNQPFSPSNDYWPETHRPENQPDLLENYNLYHQDQALQDSVHAHSAAWAEQELIRFGERCGLPEVIEWGDQANQNKPELVTHDRYGNRIDEVRFHPAYHQLMSMAMAEGIHASHWLEPKPGAHTARAAKSYLISQVEAGHGCPITMTSAAIPALSRQPDVYSQWADKIMHGVYDPRNICHEQKDSVTIGMAMTEKQGGSDVQLNSTIATAVSQAGPGEIYELTGHKYFVSAPMCDAFLMLAQTAKGLSCFLVPRWRPDGSKNPIQIQQLKRKMGNASNATSETELRGAMGWMVGDEGRGVATILEMVAMTRFDCMIGSSGLMRQGIAQIVHHCSSRSAFGKRLVDQPLMQNVLADLILEHEAALAFSMRLSRSLDMRSKNDAEKYLVRIGTAIGKYWVCKRTPGHIYEAMECIGGSGVMEDCIMPRLFRESPINAIWEGSGNVQCLDMIRAMKRTPESLDAFIEEVQQAQGKHSLMDAALLELKQSLFNKNDLEYQSRSLVGKMALTIQASTLLQYGDPKVASAFCEARLGSSNSGWVYGTLPKGIDCAALIARAWPELG